MTPIQNKNSTVTIDDEGVFVVQWKPNVRLEKEDLEKVVNDYDELSKGELWKVLHLFPKSTTVSSKARDYAEKREKPAAAEAFVIDSFIQRNLFRFYLKFRKVQYPMREFYSEDDAREWLSSISAKKAD